ncbi:SpoIIE family protein phosphatase [Streptomyces sp. H34-S5]|nr:SpoIIE family protein phosphatase [Streptomyces sp. H34-S5]MCY0939904.1 SpoIIE family protein phosphatase [Streptomyces sp. H34-AA3]MCY0949984.1 SpoIIE family protein phosphatase [Streptomyces sp. H27-S2]MCZ4086895.1 SpoIIE family protein phosphatase [Streptomyces sp. H34-S5]
MRRSCVYVVRDPHRSPCRVALAGDPPPVLVRSGQPPAPLVRPAGVCG